jgi:TPP-dependent pyruvate/acetoin dehydrogenase alpha subunit
VHERRAKGYSLEKIAEGFGMTYLRADGNSYEDVHAKAKELVDMIRKEKRPAVLECVTYRHMAHSTPLMDEKYREHDTLEERISQDPLTKMKTKLIESGITEDQLIAMEEELRSDVVSDIERAEKSPFPKKEEMYTDMYYA